MGEADRHEEHVFLAIGDPFRLHGVKVLDSLGITNCNYSFVGRFYSAFGAIEDFDSQFALKRFDVLGNGWLGKRERLGGFRVGSKFADSDKSFKFWIYHNLPLYKFSLCYIIFK